MQEAAGGLQQGPSSQRAQHPMPSFAFKPAASTTQLASSLRHQQAVQRTWSLDASMPMLSAQARTTVGPAPVNRPFMPSSFTMRPSASNAFL